jgi:hypothetical protein
MTAMAVSAPGVAQGFSPACFQTTACRPEGRRYETRDQNDGQEGGRLAKSNGGKLSRRDVFKMAVAATASMRAAGRTRAEAPHAFQTEESRHAGRDTNQERKKQPRRDRPNILFIMSDQHRGDCMGYDGNRAIRTPNVDVLARKGVRFRKAYSATQSCIPARAGLVPVRHRSER